MSMSTPGQRMGSKQFASGDSGSERDADAGPCNAEGGDRLPSGTEDAPVLDDLLVEDVSIDGMCGVY